MVSQKSELIIGLVSPVGVDLKRVEGILMDHLGQYGYKSETLKLSSFLENLPDISKRLVEAPESARINSYMDAGNKARINAGRGDFLATLAIDQIAQKRGGQPYAMP